MKRLSCFFKSKLFSLTLFLQLNLLLSLSENHYGDCLSKKCGDFDITYPFYIIDQQKSYCGYPGFEVSCNNLSVPLLNISRNSYVIKSISYDLQQFEVVNSVFDNDGGAIAARTICFDLVRNVSWERDIFQFAGHHNKVLLFRNCSEKAIQEYKLSRVKCGGIAVDGKDSKLKNILKECNKLNVTTVPYYDEGVSADVDNNITHTLERGMLLNWRAYNCTACAETGGQCGFDMVNNQFNCYCPDRTHALRCNQRKLKSRLTGILVVTGSTSLGIVFVFAVIIISAKRRQRKRGFTLEWRKEAKRNQNVEAFLKNYGSLAPKRYTHAEIRKMTNNFKEKLGEGGYGVVYKGQLLEHSRFVAVKKLKKLKADGDDFLNEVVSISRTNHVNIVSLLGFCFDGNKRALVYDFMPNGSLEKFINREGSGQSLPPVTLFGIALGIAKGLDYLHRGCNMRILHFDIKPHNILLDKELRPKISDFGLARLCSTDDSLLSLTEARGTIGYIAPEVFCRNFGGVSHKSDVYSYGMMLLDMVCGRKNIAVVRPQQSSEEYFPDWIYHQLEFQEEIDEIRNNQEQELRRKMILVGLWCIQSYPSNRPPMNRVIEMLEGPLSLLQIPPKPHLSSTPHSVLDASGTASITSMEYSIS